MDWHKTQRLRAIEIILFWHGRLNTSDIIQAFGISRIQASKDIKQYIQTNPGNMYYDFNEKTYLKALPMKLRFTQGIIDEYIDHISRMSQPVKNQVFEVLNLHYSSVKPEIISPIIQAINKQQAVSIVYASMNTPEGKSRVLYPHSLIDTGFRWHLRAYCDSRHEFRDFNIGRILHKPEYLKSSLPEANRNNDTLWHKDVTLEIIPNPLLTNEQQKLVGLEFNMKSGALYIKTRAPLVHYTLQRYQIDSASLIEPIKTQTLAIRNNKDIASYLFQ